MIRTKIKLLLRKILFLKINNRSEDFSPYYTIGSNSNFGDRNITIRDRSTQRIFLTIGDDCQIEGNFVFETCNGRIRIGNRTFIGGNTTFSSVHGITIGDDVMFSGGCTINDTNSHSVKWSERKNDVADWKKGIDENRIGKYKNWTVASGSEVIIKNKAWIGFSVIILKGVTIGEGAIVGAGSVVTKNVPDWCIVAGNPAKIVRYLEEDER